MRRPLNTSVVSERDDERAFTLLRHYANYFVVIKVESSLRALSEHISHFLELKRQSSSRLVSRHYSILLARVFSTPEQMFTASIVTIPPQKMFTSEFYRLYKDTYAFRWKSCNHHIHTETQRTRRRRALSHLWNCWQQIQKYTSWDNILYNGVWICWILSYATPQWAHTFSTRAEITNDSPNGTRQ